MAAHGPRHRLVLLPPPHRGRGAAVGPPLGRAPQGLPLAGLARRPRRGRPRGLPLDALLRLRRLHRLRHRARRGLGGAARRRQPGHRPGPPVGRRGAGEPCRPPTGGGRAHEAARPLRQARQGPLPVPPRPGPGLGAGAAPRRRSRSPTARGSRPGPRLSFGLALSTGYESLGEYLDIDLADDLEPEELVGARSNPSLPTGMEAQAAIRIPPGTDSLQQAVTSSSLADRGRRRRRRRRRRRPSREPWRPTRCRSSSSARAAETDLDARPAILALDARDGSVLVAELATQPRSLRPAELLRALDPTWTAGSVLRTHQWTSVDGARCEPIPFGDLGAAARRRPRTRKRVRHEKGTHPMTETPHRRHRRRHPPRAAVAAAG